MHRGGKTGRQVNHIDWNPLSRSLQCKLHSYHVSGIIISLSFSRISLPYGHDAYIRYKVAYGETVIDRHSESDSSFNIVDTCEYKVPFYS